MATVGSLFPTTTSSTAAADAASSTDSSNQNSLASNALGNESTFLQLLVAQLQHQDPTQPMDGTTFVTQLATFSDLEQNMGTRQDLDALSEKYLGTTTPPSAISSGSGASTSAGESTAAVQSSGTPAISSSTNSQQS